MKPRAVPEKKAQPSKAQLIYEKILGYGTLFLVLMHMLTALCRFLFNYFDTVRPVECWYLVVLLAAGVIYLCLYPLLWPKTAYRLKDFFRKLCSPAQIYCAFLLFWYVLVCWVNQNEYSGDFFIINDWWMLDTFVNCIVLFSLPRVLSVDNGKKVIEMLLHVISLAGLAIAVYALHCLFSLNVVTLPSGGQIGMSTNRTFYIGCHYNISAAIELSLILICFYMLSSQKWFIKIPYAAALLLHTYVLLLNNSRAAFVACMASYALGVFLLLWNLLCRKASFLRWISGAAAAAAAAAVLWLVRPMAFQYFEDVTHFSELLAAQKSGSRLLINTAGSVSPFIIQISDQISNTLSKSLLLFSMPVASLRKQGKRLLRSLPAAAVVLCIISVLVFSSSSGMTQRPAAQVSDASQGTAVYSVKNAFFEEDLLPYNHQAENEGEKAIRRLDAPMNREAVWKTAVKVITSNPLAFIFGVTPAAVPQAMKDLGETNITYSHAHNEVLQMGVAMGVPMMVLFAAFLIYMTINSIRLGMIEGRNIFRGAFMVPIVFAGLAVLTLAEAYLFGYFSIMSSLFFLFCGWINALTYQKREVVRNE